jgi:PAS domain S-box-containing protein
MSFTSITQRFAVWLLVLSLLPILLISYGLLHAFEKELRQTVAQQISALADKKVDQIDAYLSERIDAAMVNAQSDTMRRAVGEFAQAFAGSGVESDAYRRLDASYRDYFKRFVTGAGYYDLFLISPQGTVVYSQTHEPDFATNLFTGPYRNSGLAKATRNALYTLESSISEFEFYAPSGNAIAAFVAVPILNQGKAVGVLALQIDNARVFQVLLDKTGLGDSGETVVARLEDERTALAMAPLKSDPDAALKHKILLNNLDRDAPIMGRALNGERGSGFVTDYAGQPVAAAWRYLPHMGWGMVVKMDVEEVLAPLYRARNFSLAVLGLTLLAALLGALLLGRRLADPLRSLSISTQGIAAGRLDQRIPVVRRDELGQLTDNFNTMAERLQSFYADLEGQVRQRTAELSLALTQEQEAQGALQRERDFAASLVNTAPMIVLLLDTQGIIEYVNPYFEQLTGYRLDEVRGKEWFREFLPARDQDKIRALFQKAIHDVPTRGNINPIVTRSGKELEIEWCDQAMRDAQGTVISLLAVGQDVTERKRSEAALIEAKQAAEAASQAKSEFLANMSHEIRTPMNAILGLTQLVLDTELTPRQQDFLKKAHTSARALLGILNDILDFSKIEAGRMGIEKAPFRPEETLNHVADLFRARIEEKGLELFFEVAPDVPDEILGDPLRLTQVLTNLVSNAVKFTEHGEIHIKVEVAERTRDTLRLRFAVSDTGIGLSRAQSDRLFQPFTQANGTTTRKYGGTGLGLSICQRLVGLMGGEISVSSVECQGSIFAFTILVGVAPPHGQAQLPAQSGAPSDTGESPQSLQGMRVLLVEDNALNRLVAAKFLKRRGVALTLASHGGEAVEWVKGETFDAVLMDLHMPIMDGFEAARRIRELPQGKALPIIAMTAAVLQEDRDRCAAAGMVDFIAKPIDHDDMTKALLKWVKASRVGRAQPYRAHVDSVNYGIRVGTENVPTLPVLPVSLPGFDLEMVLRQLDGNRDLLARLLLGFAGEQSGTLAQLDALVQAGERARAAILLHTLKGVAANLGAVALAEAARQLEQEVKAGGELSAMQGFADALNAALDAIKAHIAPAQSTAGEPAIDRDVLAQVLNRLVPYLQEQELIPVELMESLRSLARSDFPDKSLARLIRQVDHFDHDGALASVVQLAAIHGVALGREDV